MPGTQATRRIIVVDPCQATREVLVRRLRAQGHEVDEAADPETGADMALSAPPCAVVADLWMPTISGVQLCRLLRSEPATADVAIVLCGDADEPRDRFWAERAGADAYVTKHRTGDLVRTIARVARGPVDQDAFFFQLGGGTVAIRDRIARHLDAALFDSVIASEVRALSTCAAFDPLFDLFVQFLSQVTSYRWVALSTENCARFALHHNPRAEGVEQEARSALGLDPSMAPILRIVDEDAAGDEQGAPPIVRPILFGTIPIGKLALSPRSDADLAAAERLLSLVARELGGPLRMASLVEESQRLAAVDGLTGLTNRRAFSETLEKEIVRAKRHGRPLSFLLLDVDHFKKINDRCGHGAGDRVLAALGRLLGSDTIRKSDSTGRWGGEEFVAAYFDTAADGARIGAERLRRAIEELVVLDDAGERIPVTASMGLAQLRSDEGLDGLVARADRAMYASKAGGRNRLTIAEGDGGEDWGRRREEAVVEEGMFH
ncbi:MAG TPA: diguanylate cyclase [Polyangiaceae bacterium]|jgi:two-component system cell cycle response regulator